MKSIIVVQTDFGIGGGSAMRGTCKKVDAELDIYDINHEVEKFNVREASSSLYHYVAYWPAGTVFVSVVDPGVGTKRRASVALLKNGSYVVTPDNGTLTLLMKEPGIAAIREIDETRNRLKGTENVSIFHGRDLFAYCGAKLASGIIDFEGVGPAYPVEEIVTFSSMGCEVHDERICGYITGAMKCFGNLESSVPIAVFEQQGLSVGASVPVVIREKGEVRFSMTVPYRTSFGYVGDGEEVVYNSSSGCIGIGINKGDFMRKYAIGYGNDWTVEFGREEA